MIPGTHSMDSGSLPTPSERRMAKYKEERRRQLASQIANRLSSNRSSSSSSDNDDDNFRFGASGGESTGSGNGSAYSKYRRHRSKRHSEKDSSLATGSSPSDKVGVKHLRRRRRRSVNGGTSPLPVSRTDRSHERPKLAPLATYPDRENGKLEMNLFREQICESTVDDDSKPLQSFQNKLYRAVPANATPQVTLSDRAQRLDSDPVRIKQTSVLFSKFSLAKDESSTSENIAPLCSSREASASINTKEQIKKSLLNTSYSSEEQLYQTASSLQSLEDEFYNSNRRRFNGQPSAPSLTTTNLSSPEMIKSVTRTLTPPISPFHQGRANTERRSPVAQHTDSEALCAQSSASALVSDPLIDMNWPGRPKRNGPAVTTDLQRPSRASPVLGTRRRSSSRGSSETDLSICLSAAAADSGAGPGTGSSSTPTTSGKPPIFPLSEKPLGCSSRSSTDLNRRHCYSTFSSFNPNEPAPPHPTPTKRTKASNALASRPYSAFIPRASNSTALKRTSFELEPDSLDRDQQVETGRRKSDFLSRYECLMTRAQAVIQAMDGLDFDQRKKKDVTDSDEEVEFNEEEVLQLCKDFLQGFHDKSNLESTQSPPTSKPRQVLGSSVPDPENQASKPNLRTRSSSLTIHDKRTSEDHLQGNHDVTSQRASIGSHAVLPKPILKKSSEDLKPTPILKNRCDLDLPATTGSSSTSSAGSVSGGILKRKSVTDSGNETAASRPDHVRIRSPSPDPYGSDDEQSDRPLSRRPILRSRRVSSSVDERASSPDYPQSILKRRSSQEDLDDCSAATSGATSRSSPEPPHSILKRKLSVGSLGSHSPEGSLGSVSSILRKKCHSQHSSCQGSLEDLSCEGEKIRSILKKRSTVSTDDELLNMVEIFHDRPKSILKGRRSEESLSPLSDPNEFDKSLRLPKEEISIRPILKQKDSRDGFSPHHESSEKSASPSRGATVQPLEQSEFAFNGSTSTRRSSLPVSPRRHKGAICEQEVSQVEEQEENESVRTSFVSKAIVYINGNFPKSSQRYEKAPQVESGDADGNNERPLSDDADLPHGANLRHSVTNSRTVSKEVLDSEKEASGSAQIDAQMQKRTILRHDSLELISDVTRLRGVLKKDSSYDTAQRPILKNSIEDSDDSVHENECGLSSNTTSSEDLDSLLGSNRAFSGVVIDPVPGGRKSGGTVENDGEIQNDSGEECELQLSQKSPVKSRKSSLVHPRQPVIPPSSVKITPDANLAMQLDCLADRAEAELEKRRIQQDGKDESTQRGSPNSNDQPTPKRNDCPKNLTRTPSIQSERKVSRDLTSEEYYKIYLETKLGGEKSRPLPFERCGSLKENSPIVDKSHSGIPRSKSFKVVRTTIAKNDGQVRSNVTLEKHTTCETDRGSENEKKRKMQTEVLGNIEFTCQLAKTENAKKLSEGSKNVSYEEKRMECHGQLSSLQSKVCRKDFKTWTREAPILSSDEKSLKRTSCNTKEMTIVGKLTSQFKSENRFAETSLSAEFPRLRKQDGVLQKMPKLTQSQQAPLLKSGYTATSHSEPSFDLVLPNVDGIIKVHLRKSGPKPQSRTHRGSRNPLKKLNSRTDLKEFGMDLFTEKEVEPKEKLCNSTTAIYEGVHSHLAVEALAGLASTEDFSSVSLRKNNTALPFQELAPFKPNLMLLEVRGRRNCQTRLVKPCKESINSNNAFILVAHNEIYNWIGKFSNVIVRSRSADVSLAILHNRDLGCKAAEKVATIQEEHMLLNHATVKAFWKLLGCPEPSQQVDRYGPNAEVEANIDNVNRVWNVDSKVDALDPIMDYWGVPMKYELLEDSSRVLVFDFGSEVYIWNGRNAPFETRRLGVKLATDLWQNTSINGHPCETKGPRRPEWCLSGKVNENMETILFREKFSNWFEKKPLMKLSCPSKEVPRAVCNPSPSESTVKLSTIDISEMVELQMKEPNLELEMACLGRGRTHYDSQEHRNYKIETLATNVWHITENTAVELTPDIWGAQFFFEESYVIRWKYKISLVGRDLKGNPSKHIDVGRERFAYFFWQGCQSSHTEKGASALMTVELDEERGPHIRVVQGKEPAAFLGLWSGNMFVYFGRRGEDQKREPRLFIIRGEVPEEAHCVEVECVQSSFRSRGCFLYVTKSIIYLWLGNGSPSHVRILSENCAEQFSKRSGTRLKVVKEGEETGDLKDFLLKGRNDYIPMIPALKDQAPSQSTRLYRLSSVLGEFGVDEISCPFLDSNAPNLMPFNQSDLYDVEQPALFLVDVGGSTLWLWQGWWPDQLRDSKDTNVSTGSGMIRWHEERKFAMQTTKEFRNRKYQSAKPPMKLVWAGNEPLEFTNLFPSWANHPAVASANVKHVGELNLEIVLDQLMRTTYTWEELTCRPLPDGVDPARLEWYLSEEDFEKNMGMTREEYASSPSWRQLEIRKEKGLF